MRLTGSRPGPASPWTAPTDKPRLACASISPMGTTASCPCCRRGPFRFATYADKFLTEARRHTDKPIKQAVISASALSLIYPAEGTPGYTREAFIADLVNECEGHPPLPGRRRHKVQIDFTEGRLSLKLDPSGGCCNSSST